MATLDTIKEILLDKLDIPAEKVTEDATLQDLGIDSLDQVEFIVELEDRLDIDFGEPEGLNTVKEVVEYLEGLLK